MLAQKLPPNVVIIGSWRCGTTLMFFLFSTGFKDVESSYEESHALDTLLPPGKWRVSKKPNDAHVMASITNKIDPYFIALARDPRDAICSWKKQKNDYHLNFEEWKRNQDFIELHKGPKVIRMRYEDLVKDPDGVQLQICSKIPGLEIRRRFSVCHKDFPKDSRILWQLDGVRPMDSSRIGIWQNHKPRIREQLELYPEMQSALEHYGYELDSLWKVDLYNQHTTVGLEESCAK